MNKVIFLLLLVPSFLFSDLQKINLQLQWKHQFEFAGFYAAKEKGYYKEVGLDVNFVEFDSRKIILNEVLENRAQYGVLYSSLVADALNDKPVVMLANFFKQSPLVLVTQKNIKSPADLKGKKIMGVSDDIQSLTLRTMLNKFHVTMKDIISVNATFKNDDFINKNVDAMAVFTTNETFDLNQKGIQYNILDPTVYGTKYYDVNLFTSQSELQNNPQRVKNFTEASIKGWQYALAHKDEMIELILKKYNTQNKTKEAYEFEANLVEQIMLPNIYKIGSIDPERIKTIANNFMQSGFVKHQMDDERLEAFLYNYDTIKAQNILNLTQQEEQYLYDKKEIRLCIDNAWMPFEAKIDGKHVGMSADYFALFQKMLHTKFKVVETKNWSESIKFIQQRKCDVLPLAMSTPEREKFMNFTSAYLKIPIILVTKSDVTFVTDVTSLDKKTIAIPKGYAFNELLRKKYPYLNIIDVENIDEGLEKVIRNEVYGYVGTLASVSYKFQTKYLSDLKIAGKFDESWELGIGVRKDDTTLLNIFQKAIDFVDETTKQQILNKWVAIKYERGLDYSLIIKIIIISIIIVFAISFWNQRLRKLNKELEVAKSKAEVAATEKANFLAIMSHEIRTPMNTVIGMAYLMQQTPLNDLQKEYLQKLESSSKNLLNLLNDILDYSKMDAGKMELDETNFNLIEVLNTIENVAKFKASEKGLAFEINYDKSKNVHFFGDNFRLTQILMNLIFNALKFTHEGRVELSVEYCQNDIYRFNIIDTGIGIAKENQEKIFSSFTQADSSTTRKYGGSGLGLAISKHLVELMHGKIYLESKLNVGSKFIIEIPLKKSDLFSKNHQYMNQPVAKFLESKKTLIDEKTKENLFKELKNSATRRRPHLCQPIINQLDSYLLGKKDQILFDKVKKLILKYKFDEAIEVLNAY